MPPNASIGYLLEHVPSVLHRQSDQVLQERLGIGLSQHKILAMIEWRSGTTQRELADYLGQTEASVSRQVGLLQQKGLLVSRVDPAERRRHLAALTPKGVRITRAAQETLDSFHASMIAHLGSKKQGQLQTILMALHEYSCASGKRMACDRTADIETMYADQTQPQN